MATRPSAFVFVSAALGLLVGFTMPCRAGEGDGVDAGKAAALALEANLDSIRTYKCRFTIIKANAANAEAALSGNYINAQKCEFSLAVDGDKFRLMTVTRIDTTPPKNLQEAVHPVTGQKTKMYSVPFIPIGELRNGETNLSYSRDFRQAQITSQRSDLPDETPLAQVYRRPSNGLKSWREAVERGQGRVSSRGLLSEKGQEAIHLEYKLDSLHVSIRFDPNQGYLPVQVAVKSSSAEGGVHEFRTHLLEAKDVGKGRWFPMHLVSFGLPKTEGQALTVQDLRVTEITVSHVTDADLALPVPAGTTIFRQDMPVGSGEYVTLKEDEHIRPGDIARIEATCKQAGSRKFEERIVTLTGKRRNWWWYFVGAGVVLLVLSAVLYRRYRLRSG